MATIPVPADLGRIQEPQDFIRHESTAIQNTVSTINGNLEINKNMNTQTVTVTFPKANTEVAVPHSLGRVANNYLVSKASTNATIFDAKTPSDAKTTYLQSNVPATVTLILH